MNRRTKSIEQRNREIYADYCAHLRNGLPAMDAYAACAHYYDLDADYIRRVIREQARKWLLDFIVQQKIKFITTFAAQFENNRVALYCAPTGKSNSCTLKELFSLNLNSLT